MTESVYLAGKDWLLPALLWLGVGAATVIWAYAQAPVDGHIRKTCMALKCVGLLLLLFCLLDPMATQERAKPGANRLALAVDNSEGLNLTDSGEKKSRAQVLKQALANKSDNWQSKLAHDFELKRYTFDARLKNVGNYQDLPFDGQSSRLGDALTTLTRRYQGQPLAGIVVFTDGVATDLEGELLLPEGMPPVYPVVIGKSAPKRDVALGTITPTQTSFEDAPVTITAQVKARGCDEEQIVAKLQLLDSAGEASALVKELKQKADGDESELTFRFQVRPVVEGIIFYRLTVNPSGEETEATQSNNSRVVVIDRGGGPYRVLYVAGRPNWEYKFLKRAVQEDEEVELTGLIRIAHKEAKFEFKGRRGENANPLARGSGQDVGDYDKPVLVRLNPANADELKTGFPAEAEELFAYSAVVIDDLEARFFTPNQHTLLHKFVSERGGGLLMLGGQESFRQGKYERTPIGNMLPVYLDKPADTTALNNLKYAITRDGWLQPWVRLRDNESAETIRLEEMTEFVSLNRVRGKKPGANVLATVSTDNGLINEPAIITQPFGRGRVGSILLGDLWRWGLKGETQREDQDKAWRQTMRWLVADVPLPFELTTTQSPEKAGRTLKLKAHDKNYQPLDNATVSIKVKTVGTDKTIPLSAEAQTEEAGTYQAQYIPRNNGGYLAEAEVRDETGKLLGRQQVGWATDFAAAEYRSLAPNRALLEQIAGKTGGRVIELGELDSFVKELPALRAPVTEIRHYPLWHQGPIFLLALVCLVAEWFIRRRKGLP